ncbi:putative Transcription factor bHLH144 [Cocos nucifera]|uniref:Putative Transcription factor bHLH144 n=1 Tax=Cocos nucifera TaxID=13894 RepID=A0A8K0HYY3_COCNU|nr:putative Transcription factor bHLH144 [Cocos nucifera]
MFHPSMAHNFGSSSFDIDGTHAHEAGKSMDRDNGSKGECPSPYMEDTEGIDALLSSEEEEEEDDDVVSTGRTPGNWGGSSFSDGMKCTKFNSSNASSSKTKKEKMKKMVRTLRGIIPGGRDQMDTSAVLDEAVKYLKSLNLEVKKLGVQNFDS